jgi:hypothetical protein
MSQNRVEERANAFTLAFSTAWETNAVEVVIKSRSKGWWSKECSEAIKHYRESHNPWHYKQFQLVIKDAGIFVGHNPQAWETVVLSAQGVQANCASEHYGKTY